MNTPTSPFQERDALVEQLSCAVTGGVTVVDQVSALRHALTRLNGASPSVAGEPTQAPTPDGGIRATKSEGEVRAEPAPASINAAATAGSGDSTTGSTQSQDADAADQESRIEAVQARLRAESAAFRSIVAVTQAQVDRALPPPDDLAPSAAHSNSVASHDDADDEERSDALRQQSMLERHRNEMARVSALHDAAADYTKKRLGLRS